MKLTKLSAAPFRGRRCRLMPAPAGNRGHRFAAYRRCSADGGEGGRGCTSGTSLGAGLAVAVMGAASSRAHSVRRFVAGVGLGLSPGCQVLVGAPDSRSDVRKYPRAVTGYRLASHGDAEGELRIRAGTMWESCRPGPSRAEGTSWSRTMASKRTRVLAANRPERLSTTCEHCQLVARAGTDTSGRASRAAA